MSWSRLPIELRVKVLSRLPFSTTSRCRGISRDTKAVVDAHRRRLRKRKVEKIEIEGGDQWTLSMHCREERKRKKFTSPAVWSPDSDCDDATYNIPQEFLNRIKTSAFDAEVSVLNLSEMRLEAKDLCRLAQAISATTVQCLEINMCSLRGLRAEEFLSFIEEISPKELRLAWLRHVPHDFFNKEMVNFLSGMSILEIVYITDSKGKSINVPISPEQLISFGCQSIHLDSNALVTQKSIDSLIMIMSLKSETRRVRLETSLRPTIHKERVTVKEDERGVTITKRK